ncbi:MAG: diguanylate cyclase [Pseudomonadota bacterium]
MKILIAEDDMTSRLILGSVLKKWGYVPVMACDGNQAWDVMKSGDAPRLAVLDWQMPGMTGIELCEKICELETVEPPYLIVLTSKDDKKDIVRALEAGANDFISKPYDNDELRARINVGQRIVKLQSELRDAYRRMEYEAMHDPLTQIFNRRTILNLLEKEMARAKREKSSLCIGMCDIDHFKTVNDTHGHQAGDVVLIAFARSVHDNLRIHDHVGRYGGEEFLIVAPGSGNANPELLFERICDQVRSTKIPIGETQVSITGSIGVARYTGNETPDTLLGLADTALYHAKKSGRDRVVCADDV